MSDWAQGDDWWMASDGKWYPPTSRAVVAPPPPPPLGISASPHWGHQPPPPTAAPRATLSPTLTAWVKGLMIVTTLAMAGGVVAALVAESRFVDYFQAPIGRDAAQGQAWIDADEAWGAVNLVTNLGVLVTGIVFVIWAFKAHEVTNAHRPVIRYWARGWTIGGWFIPIGNAFIPKLVLNEIERLATDIHVGPSNEWRRHRTARSGWVWWLGWAAFWVLSFTSGLLMDNIPAYAIMSESGSVRTVYQVSAAAGIAGVVAGVAGVVYVGVIGRLLDLR